jgi:caffeoyl-CoA O-methyltransferase
MISGHVQGKLLEMIVRMIRPQRVLEIGTFTGYSALSMAAGLPEGGVIDTCEVDDELEMFILDFFERSQYAERLNLHIGSALDTMQTLDQVYDLVFIDGDKREYTAYYNMLFDKGLVRSGSWIMADNILWYGKVVEPVAKGDKQTQGIIDFNNAVAADPRVENVILPIRDGINLIRVK